MVMAATTAGNQIKNGFLPKEETEDEDEVTDPRAELMEQLLAVQAVSNTCHQELKDRQIDARTSDVV